MHRILLKILNLYTGRTYNTFRFQTQFPHDHWCRRNLNSFIDSSHSLVNNLVNNQVHVSYTYIVVSHNFVGNYSVLLWVEVQEQTDVSLLELICSWIYPNPNLLHPVCCSLAISVSVGMCAVIESERQPFCLTSCANLLGKLPESQDIEPV